MSLQDRLRASTASFAHLVSPNRAAAQRAEDDERDYDDDKKDAKRAEDDKRDDGEGDEDKKDAKRSKRAADDDDKRDDEDDDKKDVRADDDGDDDSDKEEMRGRSAIARARSRERARCAAIFMSRHAAANPAMAASLAFSTTLSRREAIAILASAPAGNRGDREMRNPRLGPGGEPMPSSSQAIASSWDRAFAKTTKSRRSA